MPYTYTAKALKLPINGVDKTFELKDAVARAATVGGIHFLGTTTTALTDGSEATSITVGGEAISVSNGDVAVYGGAEYIYSTADNKWHEFGDLSGLGSLAIEDDALIDDYTPVGTFTGFDVELNVIDSKYVIADNENDVGSVTAGSADSLTMTVPANSETLQISFSASTPTAVTLPTFTQQDIATGVTSVTQPTFGANAVTVTAAPAV